MGGDGGREGRGATQFTVRQVKADQLDQCIFTQAAHDSATCAVFSAATYNNSGYTTASLRAATYNNSGYTTASLRVVSLVSDHHVCGEQERQQCALELRQNTTTRKG